MSGPEIRASDNRVRAGVLARFVELAPFAGDCRDDQRKMMSLVHDLLIKDRAAWPVSVCPLGAALDLLEAVGRDLYGPGYRLADIPAPVLQ